MWEATCGIAKNAGRIIIPVNAFAAKRKGSILYRVGIAGAGPVTNLLCLGRTNHVRVRLVAEQGELEKLFQGLFLYNN